MFAGITKTQPREVKRKERIPTATRKSIARAIYPDCPQSQLNWIEAQHELEIVRLNNQRFVVHPNVTISFVKQVQRETDWERSIFIDQDNQTYCL